MTDIIDSTGSQFFADQQVQAEDLNNIQYSTIQTFRAYLKSITKTPGVYLNTYTSPAITAGALGVTCNSTGTTFTVAPGAGVDALGNLIIVPSSTEAIGDLSTDPAYYPERPTRTALPFDVTGNGTYFINIYPDTMYSFSEPDDSGNTHNTRAYDSYEIKVESSQITTGEESGGGGLTLARVILDGGSIKELNTGDTDYDLGYEVNGITYALFDDRIGYVAYDQAKGDLTTKVDSLYTAVFEEELEKSVSFIFPADGHSMVTKIHRDITFVRMELYVEATAVDAGVTFSYYINDETVFSNDITAEGELTVTATSSVTIAGGTNIYTGFDTVTTSSILDAGGSMKFLLLNANDSVTRATCTLVYKRR